MVRREWLGGGKAGRARMDGKNWHRVVAVVAIDKRDWEEHYKHDSALFLRGPVGRSGELHYHVKCEGQVSGKISPSIPLTFKKYL